MFVDCGSSPHYFTTFPSPAVRGGEGTADWDTAASNCSTGNCLSNFNRRTSSKSSKLKRNKLDEGFQPCHPTFRILLRGRRNAVGSPVEFVWGNWLVYDTQGHYTLNGLLKVSGCILHAYWICSRYRDAYSHAYCSKYTYWHVQGFHSGSTKAHRGPRSAGTRAKNRGAQFHGVRDFEEYHSGGVPPTPPPHSPPPRPPLASPSLRPATHSRHLPRVAAVV